MLAGGSGHSSVRERAIQNPKSKIQNRPQPPPTTFHIPHTPYHIPHTTYRSVTVLQPSQSRSTPLVIVPSAWRAEWRRSRWEARTADVVPPSVSPQRASA